MADQVMPNEARERQSAALLKAEELAVKSNGKSRTKLAAALDLGYDQYARYVNGQTPLRIEQIAAFAEAYDVDLVGLGQAIMTGDLSTVIPWDFRSALRGRIQENQIAEEWARWQDAPLQAQKGAVSAILAEAERRRSGAMTPPKPAPRRRQRAENRSA